MTDLELDLQIAEVALSVSVNPKLGQLLIEF